MNGHAPWRWTEFGDLEDATGDFVLWVSEEGQGKADPTFSIGTASNYARSIIGAAPEMEMMLRVYVAQSGACPSCKKTRPALLHNGALPRGWHAEGCALCLFLARIDAAKAGE